MSSRMSVIFSRLSSCRNERPGWLRYMWEEVEEEEVDDLMRMAAETESFAPDDVDFETATSPVFSTMSGHPHSRHRLQGLCQMTCQCGKPLSKEKPSCVLLILSLFLLLSVSGISVSLGYYSILIKQPKPVIDKSIDSFSIPNHSAYIHNDAFMLARRNNASRYRYKRETNNFTGSLTEEDYKRSSAQLQEKRYRCSSDSVIMTSNQLSKRWKMHVIYLAQGDNNINIFTEERLQMIHNIEQSIMSHPRFTQFCLRDPKCPSPARKKINDCAPLNSLLTYFFPSKDSDGQIFYDGMGTNMDDLSSALNLAMNYENFYYFVDDKINKTFKKSRFLRTEVLFGAPLQGFNSLGDHTNEQADLFKDFVKTYVDLLSKVSTSKVQVLYGGNELFDYEVEHTFWNDVYLAVFACAAIATLMFILTSFSVYLTILGIWCILLSFPLAFFFYRVVFNIIALGILNGAAAFVMIGIGVDDVFVFINVFRQSTHMPSVKHRLKYTVRTAGVATFLTSFTTSVAFAANVATSIPAVYEFGLFMSLIVGCCWLTVFFLMPPVLYIYAFWFEPLEQCCAHLCLCCVQKRSESTYPVTDTYASSVSNDDDDVPLLQIEDNGEQMEGGVMENEDGGDVSLLGSRETSAVDRTQLSRSKKLSSNSSCIGKLQQQMLSAFVNKVVIKFRIPIIVLFTVLLGISIGLAVQLRPSDHPPQLFQPNTNLQRLMDLKANFTSIDSIQCDHCSALYNINSDNQGSQKHQVPEGGHDSNPTPNPPFQTLATPEKNNNGHLPNRMTSPTNIPRPFQTTSTTTTTTTTAKATTTTTTRTTSTTTIATRKDPTHDLAPQQPENNSDDDNNNNQPVNSVDKNFDVCKLQNCNNLKERPHIQSGATVYVVFGIQGLDRSGVSAGHVLTEFRGNVVFDENFSSKLGIFPGINVSYLQELCQVCNLLAANTNLVRNGTARCLPDVGSASMQALLLSVEECNHLPTQVVVNNQKNPAKAEISITRDGRILWLAFAFESTTSQGKSFFQAYSDYLNWESYLQLIRDTKLSPDSPLKSMFQTSDFWTKVMMEVVAVNSAIYSLVLSLIICICTVAIFTGHAMLLFIIFITIVGMILLVVAIFYMAGWQMGAVEAVSLSILVGSSVDYCMHLVEGYLVAGKQLADAAPSMDNGFLRRERVSGAIKHIGSSILSSALTTIVAAVPLIFTTIQPFSKFGSIILINSSISIVFTLVLCTALLSVMAPARFVTTWRSHLKAFFIICLTCGTLLLVLYICKVAGIYIPGPNGGPLFG